jgi:hypothetical protein
MPTPRKSTRPGSRSRPAISEAARAAASSAPTMRMLALSCKREACQSPAGCAFARTGAVIVFPPAVALTR